MSEQTEQVEKASDEALEAALAQHGLQDEPGPTPLSAPEPLAAPAESHAPEGSSDGFSSASAEPPADAPDSALLEKALRIAPMERIPEGVIRGMNADELKAWHSSYVDRENRIYREKAELAEVRKELEELRAAPTDASTEEPVVDSTLPKAVSEELSEDAAKSLSEWISSQIQQATKSVVSEVQRTSAAERGVSLVTSEIDRLTASGEIPSDLPSEAQQRLLERTQQLAALDGPWNQEGDAARAVSSVVQAALRLEYPEQMERHALSKLIQSREAQRNGAPHPGRRAAEQGKTLSGPELEDAMLTYILSEQRAGRSPSPGAVREKFGLNVHP